ncbi:hypothetical protein D5038_05420 [Verminephrobacter aporrectodeae subsp. tuberculatae]|nr:hypothetical protein [Verminephrobacter aporrectodeae subsp. tuberculatae]
MQDCSSLRAAFSWWYFRPRSVCTSRAIAHFLLGLFLPFLFYRIDGMRLTFWIGMALTATWHFGYAFWEDLLDCPVYTPD